MGLVTPGNILVGFPGSHPCHKAWTNMHPANSHMQHMQIIL